MKLSVLCPCYVRQFTSRSRQQSENGRAKTVENLVFSVFGRQGPEVRILSPRPRILRRQWRTFSS